MADTDRIKRNLGKMIDAGAPEWDIDAYLKTEGFNSPDEWRAASAPKPGMLERVGKYARGLVDEAANLGTGLSDELGAAVDATIPTQFLYKTSQAPTWSERYNENLAAERGRMKEFRTQNPVASTAANVTGSVVGALNLPRSIFTGGSLATNIAKGAASGAALGGLQGFGEGEGEGRMQGAKTGALVGGVVGGAMPIAGSGLNYAYEKFAPPVLNKLADIGERFVPKGQAMPLSAAAPEGGSVAQDSWITSMVDTARSSGTKTTEDAATRRLALELQRSGGVQQARQRLGELGEGAFLADTSRGARRLAEVGTMLPGEAGEKYTAAFNARNAQTGPRFLGAMGEQGRVPSVYDTQRFLEAYKSHTGSQLYDPVLRSGKFNVSPEMEDLLKVPAIRETMDQIIADGEKYGVNLGTAEAAHMVKRMLNQNTEAAFQSGRAVNKSMVQQAGDAWEKALWDANPAIREADAAYAKVASLPDWLERGQNFMRTGQSDAAINVSPSALANDIATATPQQMQALRVGSSNVMRDAATSGPDATRRLGKALLDNEPMQQKLGEIYGPETTSSILRQANAERTFQETRNRVLAGSPTAERLAAAADDAALSIPTGGGSPSPLSIFQMLADKYQQVRQPSEGVRSRLADLLANGSTAANAETLALVEELLRRQAASRPISAGIAGATGGNLSSPR